MATKKRKEDDEAGLEKKRRKSGVAANGSELHEEQQPIVSFSGCSRQHLFINMLSAKRVTGDNNLGLSLSVFVIYDDFLCLPCFDSVGWAAGRASSL